MQLVVVEKPRGVPVAPLGQTGIDEGMTVGEHALLARKRLAVPVE